MAQNIYDQPGFFAGYSQLRRSIKGLDGAAEWPAIRAMLPPMRGLRVVDLGCGFGWFCRWALGQGAASVLGLDVSENMLNRARAESEPGIRYELADLGRLTLPADSFDLVYSSLALHYLEDVGALLRTVHMSLAPGGRLVFSTEHPIYMAPSRPGWSTDGEGRKTWSVDRYCVEGERTTDWLAPGVRKYHRTIGTTVNALIAAGFMIRRLEEFCPTPEQIAAEPVLALELERPTFLLVSAQRED